MPVNLVVGIQWGDEGKGRIVDYLCANAHIAARFGGGANAGHTVVVGDKTYKLRIVPSGVVTGVAACVIGPGTVVNPESFLAEIDALDAAGIDTSRVWISDLAQLILPYHIELDRAAERARGSGAIGTTGNGIGPAYGDRVARCGIRAGDLRNPAYCRATIEARAATLAPLGINVDSEGVALWLEALAPRVLRHVRDTVTMLHDALRSDKHVLVEGAQGSMLDVTFGTYPFVTSSATVAGASGAGLGFGPTAVESVMGVVKAYTTRVGGGPFPTELLDSTGERLRSAGREFGVVTGRARRCGWLDLAMLRYTVQVNGITELALTKLDVLDGFDEIKVGVAYRGNANGSVPFQIAGGAEPEYRTFAGWSTSTTDARTFDRLPAAARDYVSFIERECGVPITLISVGPERRQIIERGVRTLAGAAPA
jgi:adenylosuccinate synthase